MLSLFVLFFIFLLFELALSICACYMHYMCSTVVLEKFVLHHWMQCTEHGWCDIKALLDLTSEAKKLHLTWCELWLWGMSVRRRGHSGDEEMIDSAFVRKLVNWFHTHQCGKWSSSPALLLSSPHPRNPLFICKFTHNTSTQYRVGKNFKGYKVYRTVLNLYVSCLSIPSIGLHSITLIISLFNNPLFGRNYTGERLHKWIPYNTNTYISIHLSWSGCSRTWTGCQSIIRHIMGNSVTPICMYLDCTRKSTWHWGKHAKAPHTEQKIQTPAPKRLDTVAVTPNEALCHSYRNTLPVNRLSSLNDLCFTLYTVVCGH